MREYLEMEFSELRTTLPFEFDLEAIIDDWVILNLNFGSLLLLMRLITESF